MKKTKSQTKINTNWTIKKGRKSRCNWIKWSQSRWTPGKNRGCRIWIRKWKRGKIRKKRSKGGWSKAWWSQSTIKRTMRYLVINSARRVGLATFMEEGKILSLSKIWRGLDSSKLRGAEKRRSSWKHWTSQLTAEGAKINLLLMTIWNLIVRVDLANLEGRLDLKVLEDQLGPNCDSPQPRS